MGGVLTEPRARGVVSLGADGLDAAADERPDEHRGGRRGSSRIGALELVFEGHEEWAVAERVWPATADRAASKVRVMCVM